MTAFSLPEEKGDRIFMLGDTKDSQRAGNRMEQAPNGNLVKLLVHGVLRDPNTETQIVILKDEQNQETLPIWVGLAEGDSISHAMNEAQTPRPMTHDLIRSLTDHLGIKVTRVVVTDVQANTYYATIYMNAKGTERTVDSRPSDAIALALRTQSPIFATKQVLQARGGGSLEAWLDKFGVKQAGASEDESAP
jgi:bifunctional DNase/RNase